MRKTFVLTLFMGFSAWAQPVPLPPGVAGGPMPQSTAAGPFGPQAVPDGDGGYREDHAGFRVRIERDGTIRFEDKATFDLTDAFMRLHGRDPYTFDKAAVVASTRVEREKVAAIDLVERLWAALARMPATLEGVWGRTSRPAVTRRATLFLLWQEVAETGADQVVLTGRMVRATIIAFIRRRLPEGSPDGYTRAEIEALNRRRSCTAPFEPYR